MKRRIDAGDKAFELRGARGYPGEKNVGPLTRVCWLALSCGVVFVGGDPPRFEDEAALDLARNAEMCAWPVLALRADLGPANNFNQK
jgi:hypothetical protein